MVNVSQPGAKSAKMVRLLPVGERIIRVSATAESSFADPQSLVVLPQQSPRYTQHQHGDTITIATSQLQAHVLQSTGRVWFTDSNGHTLLAENGTRDFTPYKCTQIHADGTPENYHGWSIQQAWLPAQGEAFYGLGQHQADDWNYRGRNEELFQYNTKVSLPFVVSSRNYGVMLDSYSLCRFGNPKDYSQLGELFTLYDKQGQTGALTGTYSAPGQETLVRREEGQIYSEIF